MSLRLLLLSPRADLPSRALHVDGSGRVLERSGPLLARASAAGFAAGATRTVAVVPGTQARALWLALPAHNPTQALAAARVLVEDGIATREGLHLAIAPRQGDATRLVVVVDRAVLQDWLARAEFLGAVADAVVPEQLLLPEPDGDAVRVFDAGDRWIARGDGLAFSAEPALAAQVLAGRPQLAVSATEYEQWLATTAAAPAIDLRQYEFATRDDRTSVAAPYRRALWLAIALLASPLLLVAAQALRYEVAARGLESRAATMARAVLPGDANPSGDADPTARLQARLRGVQAPEQFAAATAALFAAVAGTRDASLHALDYAREDALRATLVHGTPEDLESVRGALAASGWRLVAGGSVAADGGLRTDLLLEPAP